jgi:hypothetical protein
MEIVLTTTLISVILGNRVGRAERRCDSPRSASVNDVPPLA